MSMMTYFYTVTEYDNGCNSGIESVITWSVGFNSDYKARKFVREELLTLMDGEGDDALPEGFDPLFHESVTVTNELHEVTGDHVRTIIACDEFDLTYMITRVQVEID